MLILIATLYTDLIPIQIRSLLKITATFYLFFFFFKKQYLSLAKISLCPLSSYPPTLLSLLPSNLKPDLSSLAPHRHHSSLKN